MKKNTILSKKWLLLPKIVSMVEIVGGKYEPTLP